MGWVKGLEPSTYGTTTRRSSQLSYTHHVSLAQRKVLCTDTSDFAREILEKVLQSWAISLDPGVTWREYATLPAIGPQYP